MNALVPITATHREIAALSCEGFNFAELSIFTAIPNHRDVDVVGMNGMVIVFDKRLHLLSDLQEGALYVREFQRPPSNMAWRNWLNLELEHEGQEGRHSPFSSLNIVREVVQAVTYMGGPAMRLASGFIDGPYKEWSYGSDLIGKVVGIYRPGGGQ